MDARYRIVKTLIRGKQNAKTVVKNVDGKPVEKVTFHKKPIGYVLQDLKNNKIVAMSYVEAVEAVLVDGAENAEVTATLADDGKGGKVTSPYLKKKEGFPSLQSPEIVVDPDVFLSQNKNVSVTSQLADDLKKKVRAPRGSSKKQEPKYTKEALLAAIKAKKEALKHTEATK